MALRKHRPRRPNATGRTEKSGRFVMLPHRILESAAYASLDLTARALLTELVMIYKGSNNGSLYLSTIDATSRLGLTDKRPALRAFDDLQDRGFVTLAKDAHFAVKASESSRARCWRLTWEAWPECPQRKKRGPTNEWQQYQPPGKTAASRRADARLRSLDKYRRADAAGRFPGVNFTPANSANDAIPPFPVGGNFTPHIDVTMGRGVLGWWSSGREGQIAAQILMLNLLAHNRPLPLARAA